MDDLSRQPSFDQHQFAVAVEGSQDLLNYAAQAGIAISEESLRALVHAKACLSMTNVPEDVAVAFYTALTRLAAAVAPVTVDTLRISNEKTARSLRRNGILAICFALLVVIFSGVSFVTTNMSRDLADGISHANDLAVKLRSQVQAPKPNNIQETTCGVATSPPDPAIPVSDELLLISELQDFASTIRIMLRTATKLDFFVADWEKSPLAGMTAEWKEHPQDKLQLEPALVNMRKAALCKIATYQDVREFAQNVRADSTAIYGALSNYLLPVLYALLGACAFNLRDFSDRVKQRTYHPSSYSNTARTIAAMTVGTIISLFGVFNHDTSLPPFAVAFLAGYGVEVFFAFLDALLSTVNAPRRAEPPTTRPV
jgi:hypothetical protein